MALVINSKHSVLDRASTAVLTKNNLIGGKGFLFNISLFLLSECSNILHIYTHIYMHISVHHVYIYIHTHFSDNSSWQKTTTIKTKQTKKPHPTRTQSKNKTWKKDFTKEPQNKQGPEPSCSQTIRPQTRQLLMSLCFWPRQSHGWRPGSRTASLSCPSLVYKLTNLVFFFTELLLSCAW